MSERISVKEYAENRNLLELNYVPYEQRVEICRTILSQCINLDDYASVDSVLLDRVKTEIFISSITNLDFSETDENELDGYDQLCYYELLDETIDLCGSFYKQFEHILELMLKDYADNEASLKGYLNTQKNNLVESVSSIAEKFSTLIEGLDAQEIAKFLDFVNMNPMNEI